MTSSVSIKQQQKVRRWSEISEAVRSNVAASEVLDASMAAQLASHANTSHIRESLLSIRSAAVSTASGGHVLHPEMILSHGNLLQFPPGVYLIKLVFTDVHGNTGSSLLGARSLMMSVLPCCSLRLFCILIQSLIESSSCASGPVFFAAEGTDSRDAKLQLAFLALGVSALAMYCMLQWLLSGYWLRNQKLGSHMDFQAAENLFFSLQTSHPGVDAFHLVAIKCVQ